MARRKIRVGDIIHVKPNSGSSYGLSCLGPLRVINITGGQLVMDVVRLDGSEATIENHQALGYVFQEDVRLDEFMTAVKRANDGSQRRK